MGTEKKKKIVKPVTLSEQAYAIIKDEIITNQIKPGDLLTEEQLSERLSISRTPIRSALKQLVMEHLAEVNENKIVMVSNVTSQDIANVLVVRCSLEPLAVSLLEGKIGTKQIKELNKIMKKLTQAKNHQVFLEAEYDFHMAFARYTGNTFLYDMIEKINMVCKRYLVLSGTLDKYTPAALEEHQRIVDLLEQNKIKEASEAMHEHVKNAGERMLLS